jgi:hypothetical protein
VVTLSTNTQVKDKNISLKARTVEEVNNEKFTQNHCLWVPFEDAQQIEIESESFKKQLGYVVDDRDNLTKKISEANKILEEWGCGDCTPAVLLREILK